MCRSSLHRFAWNKSQIQYGAFVYRERLRILERLICPCITPLLSYPLDRHGHVLRLTAVQVHRCTASRAHRLRIRVARAVFEAIRGGIHSDTTITADVQGVFRRSGSAAAPGMGDTAVTAAQVNLLALRLRTLGVRFVRPAELVEDQNKAPAFSLLQYLKQYQTYLFGYYAQLK